MKKLFTPLILFFVIFLIFPKTPSANPQTVFSILPNSLAAGEITTVIGGDRASGDGDLAIQASLNSPNAIVFDKAGNLLIADTNNHRIRKIDLVTGKITTIAGNGKPGFTGDGEPAITAGLNFPTAIALGERDSLFIADSGNNRIRRVDPDSSVITTVAGNGDTNQDRDGVLATETTLTSPFALAIDKAGNLYTLQAKSFRIRYIDANSRTITTVAGNGQPGVSKDGEKASSANLIPVAIAIDNQDNLLIAEADAMPQIDNLLISNRIRRVDSQTGILSTIAGNACNPFRNLNCSFVEREIATKTSLISPRTVTTDNIGNIFISDDDKIKRIDRATGVITTLAGNGKKVLEANNGDGDLASKAIIFPINLAVDKNGNIFIADNGYDQIRRIDFTTNIIDSIAGLGIGDGGQANSAKLVAPQGLAFDEKGTLFIADTLHQLVRRVDDSGKITTVAGTGKKGFNGDGKLAIEADLSNPTQVTVDSKGNLFIIESINRIRFVDAVTKQIRTIVGTEIFGFSGDGGLAVNAKLNTPTAIATDSTGNLFIADTGNNRIRRVDMQSGNISTIAGNGQAGFSGDGGQAINASLSPVGLAVDNNNNLLVVDNVSNRIRSINLGSGVINTIAGSGKIGFKGDGKIAKKASFKFPTAIAVDKSNSIFIADTFNNRVRRIDSTTTIITTVAGDGMDAYVGDNGLATKASLSMPSHIAVDKQGNLFITDKKNNVIRAVKGQ